MPRALEDAVVVRKNAVRAFSECLRGELAEEPDIDVATMVPQAVDTPIFEHAGGAGGRSRHATADLTQRADGKV